MNKRRPIKRAECTKEGAARRKPEGGWAIPGGTSGADSFGFSCVEQGFIWSILSGRKKNICNLNIFKEKVKFCFKKTKTHSWQKRDPLHEDCEATPQVILQGPQMVGVEYLSPSTQNHCDG